MGKYWLKYAHSTNYWQVDIDKKWAKYTTCSQAMGMLNIERNAVHGTLFVHSQSKVILTNIMENVWIILLVQSWTNYCSIWFTMHTLTTCSKWIVNIDQNDNTVLSQPFIIHANSALFQ